MTISIQAVGPDESAIVARLHHLSHTISYRRIFPDEWIGTRERAAYEAVWAGWLADQWPVDLTALALDDEVPVGFIRVEQLSNRYKYFDTCLEVGLDPATTGVVRQLHVHPQRLGMGIGQRLMAHGKTHMRNLGWTHAVLDTHEPNERARHFYESDGWGAVRTLTRDDVPVLMLLYRCTLG